MREPAELRCPDAESLAPASRADSIKVLQAMEVNRFRVLGDLLVEGRHVHEEVTDSYLFMESLAEEADGYTQVGAIHLDCSALLLAMGADPHLRPQNGIGLSAA